MDSQLTISLRIKTLVEFFANGNNTKFAQLIGTSEANVRNYLKGSSPKVEVLNAIVEKFEISYEWLMLGKGEMFEKQQNKQTEPDSDCNECIKKDKHIDRLEKHLDRQEKEIDRLNNQLNALIEPKGKRASG